MEIGVWDVAAVAIKTITYAATLSAAGGVAFLVYNGRRLPSERSDACRRWVEWCVGVALLASLARIGILSGSMSNEVASVVDWSMVRMVIEAGEERATGLRLVGLLALACSLMLRRRLVWLAVGGAIAAATSFAWIGHAWSVSKDGGVVVLLSLHLACVAFWLGALVPLLIASKDDDVPRIAAIVHSFGLVAAYVVAVLAAAGVLLLVVFLSAPSELWTTEYGRSVSIKLGAAACLLGVAAFNKLRLTPRLRAGDHAAVAALRRSIRVEIAIGLFILLTTAFFTTVVGPVSLE